MQAAARPRRRPAKRRRTSAASRPGRPAEPRSIPALLWAAGISAAPGALLLVLYALPELQGLNTGLAMVASFAPYGWLTWLVAVVLAVAGARGRTRLVVAPLALGLAWHTGILVAYLPAPARATAASSRDVRILELNLKQGLADLDALADRVRGERPDILVLTEATTADQAEFGRKAWTARFPYLLGTVGAAYDTATGTGDSRGTLVLSRYPAEALGYTRDTRFTNLAVRVSPPVGHPFTLVAAHPANPTHGVEAWLGDGEALTRFALQYASGPLVVAGDLNATAEHLTLRELAARAGLTDAATGQGWQPTYPADTWYPPLIQIDHVLASEQFRTTGYRTLRVPGTDHLGLLVDLAFS